MSNYNNLKSSINNNIYENQTQQITGTVLNAILNEMTNALGAGYQFAGVATVGMTPSEPDARIFYLAGEGIYTSFDGIQVPAGKLGILKWDNRWHLETIDGLGSGGANLTGYVTVASTDDLPDEGVATLGYLCGENLYLYVGEGGDTKEGKYQNCGSFRGPQGDSVQDVEQTQTSLENGGVNKIKFTLSNGISCEFQVRNGTTSSGLFPTLAALQAAYPSPVVGQYAFVGAGFPADIYVCTTAGTWTDSGEDYDGDNVDLTDYATKAEVNELDLKVDDIEDELHEINQHITGRMGIGDTNEDITPTSLPEYTDQYGIATIVFNTPGYLWVCLENEYFRVTSGGIEIPMVYVKESGNLHCYVSAEIINSGTLQFNVESIHPIKSDTERLILTARSYTITYGDEIPEFGYTANGEVEGDPVITCEATSESGVGTYTIHIARGTVTDANAVYVDGVLVIQKAELVVTADNKTVGIGGQMPTFTVQYSGFVNGEDVSDLTTAPTCTTNAVDTSTPGTYTIVPSGGVADNYSFTYVNGTLLIGIVREISQAQIEQSGSCGAYIGTTGQYLNKWTTSTTYYGIILDVRQYQGMTLRFARREGSNWMRFALLTSPTVTNHASPSYISDEGYTTQVQHDYEEGDTYFDLVIPASASYLYIYTFSNSGGTYTGPGGITVLGTMPTSEMKDMEASLFSTQTSIGDNGTVYTGSSASTVVCTGYLSANEYGYLGVMKFLHNNAYPEGVTRFRTNIAYYDPNKRFIKRDSYRNISDDISTAYEYILPPSCGFIRVMVTQLNGDTQLSGDTIRFDNDDIQSKGTATS